MDCHLCADCSRANVPPRAIESRAPACAAHANVWPKGAVGPHRSTHIPQPAGLRLARLVCFTPAKAAAFVDKLRSLPASERRKQWKIIVTHKLDDVLRTELGLPPRTDLELRGYRARVPAKKGHSRSSGRRR